MEEGHRHIPPTLPLATPPMEDQLPMILFLSHFSILQHPAPFVNILANMSLSTDAS